MSSQRSVPVSAPLGPVEGERYVFGWAAHLKLSLDAGERVWLNHQSRTRHWPQRQARLQDRNLDNQLSELEPA